jgi:hypothetical protein
MGDSPSACEAWSRYRRLNLRREGLVPLAGCQLLTAVGVRCIMLHRRTSLELLDL